MHGLRMINIKFLPVTSTHGLSANEENVFLKNETREATKKNLFFGEYDNGKELSKPTD